MSYHKNYRTLSELFNPRGSSISVPGSVIAIYDVQFEWGLWNTNCHCESRSGGTTTDQRSVGISPKEFFVQSPIEYNNDAVPASTRRWKSIQNYAWYCF